ncbi:hypothetical protein CDAR_480221 [Caerostris darwini]|uniref:Uncharacterized protein n=1 Tax=Caerostris darwini TaxID=1538125 RepID=A0AAV4V1C7_9ARAC|nr:hypothetical protein CDAR_480221 [Caerostris darwini]
MSKITKPGHSNRITSEASHRKIPFTMRRSVNPQTTLGRNQDGTSTNLSLVSGPAINSNPSQRQSPSCIRSPENISGEDLQGLNQNKEANTGFNEVADAEQEKMAPIKDVEINQLSRCSRVPATLPKARRSNDLQAADT